LHFIGDKQKETRPWHPENPFYHEWSSNLERAELIDLKKIQKSKKWNLLKIKYYSLYPDLYKAYKKVYGDLKYSPFRYKLESFFRYKLNSFFRYKLKYFFIYIIMTPDRLLGKIGICIKKHHPDLYQKLKNN
jgi:hypothetical protein